MKLKLFLKYFIQQDLRDPLEQITELEEQLDKKEKTLQSNTDK